MLDADKKIRRLIKRCSISETIPKTLSYLKETQNTKFENSEKNVEKINDGPQAIKEIRNSLIHGSKWRRANLDKITTDARIDAWILANWYLELLILHELKYNGMYNNRTVSVRQGWSSIELVPWAKKGLGAANEA